VNGPIGVKAFAEHVQKEGRALPVQSKSCWQCRSGFYESTKGKTTVLIFRAGRKRWSLDRGAILKSLKERGVKWSAIRGQPD